MHTLVGEWNSEAISNTGKAKPNLHGAWHCSTRHRPPTSKVFKVAILRWRREATQIWTLSPQRKHYCCLQMVRDATKRSVASCLLPPTYWHWRSQQWTKGGGSWTKANERNLHKFCYDKIIYIYTQYFYIEPGYWSCTGTKPPSQTTLGPHQAHPTNRVEPHRLIQKSRIFPWPYPPWPPWPNTFHLFPFIS
jgi:hypothetical protein